MGIIKPYNNKLRPATVPLFSFMQYRDDNHKYLEDIVVAFPNWGIKLLPQYTSIDSSSVLDFVFPVYHSKNPLIFELAKSVYTEKNLSMDNSFVQRILKNEYTKYNIPDFSKYRLTDVSRVFNPIPFITFTWDENYTVFMEYHQTSRSSARAGSLLYQLTKKFTTDHSLWCMEIV